MPPELGIPKEEVRVLAAAIGQRPAARELGLNENTVKSICLRAGDGRTIEAAESAKAGKALHPNAPKAADALSNVLSDRHKHTKLGLSLFTARAARVASRLPKEQLLAQAPDVKAVADIMGKVWPEQGIQSIRLSMFTRDQPIEVEAEFIADCGTDVEPASTQGSQE